MSTKTTNVLEAIRLFGAYTGGRFSFSLLTGPAKASCRTHILSALLGTRIPQSAAGINRLRDEMFNAGGIPDGCLAAKEDSMREYCILVSGGRA